MRSYACSRAQIAMTPRGTYRSALESHLVETRDHADRVGRRLQFARPEQATR